MGKSGGAKRQVVEYRLATHYGVCWQTDAITALHLNEKVMWEGRLTQNGVIDIYQPMLFGGPQKEGGAVGKVFYMQGRPDQEIDPEVAQHFGLTPETCPAFRHYTSLLFTGSGKYSSPGLTLPGVFQNVGAVFGAGIQPGAEGFMWSMNNPVAIQALWMRHERAPKGLDPAIAMIEIGKYPEANPAHIIYECYTNEEWGLGENPQMMGQSWGPAAQQLYNEGFGLCFKWTQPTEIKEFVGEVNTHINALVFLDTETGKHEIKLLRDDYNINDLKEINPDNADLSDFKRRMPGEIINEITVKYTDPDTGEMVGITVHDIASIEAQGGAPRHEEHSYPGIRRADLATTVAARDVQASVAPVITCKAKLDRRYWNVKPGDCLIMNWPENRVVNAIMRVGKVNQGKPGSTAITVDLTTDIFSLTKRPIEPAPTTAWTDLSEDPAPMAFEQVFTLPAYFAATGVLQDRAIDLEYPEVLAAAMGYQDGYDTFTYELVYDAVTPDGMATLLTAGIKPITERSVLDTPLISEATSALSREIVLNPDRGPRVGGFIYFGYGDENSEIALVTGVQNGDWQLARGMLDTIPRPWPVGTPVWFVNAGSRLTDDRTIRAAGETVEYQFLSRTSRGMLALADAPVHEETLTARPHLPLRPANCKVNGVGFGPVSVLGQENITFSWATRNRQLEDGLTYTWTEDSIPPEYKQMSRVTLFDDNGAEIIQYRFWLEDEFTIPASHLARWTTVRARFDSEREGLTSLNSHSIWLTGLPGNVSAPPPPAAPELGEAPSPIPAPAPGAYEIVAGALTTADAGSIPAIVIEGIQDNPAATQLVTRYKRPVGTDWAYKSPIQIDGRKVRIEHTGMAPQTTYQVEVAYIINNVIGLWRSLGQVTTGALVSGSTLMDGLDFDELVDAALEASDNARAAMDAAERNAEAIIVRAVDNYNDEAHNYPLLFLDGEWMGTQVVRERTERQSETGALAQEFFLIEAQINTPGTGISARVGSLEQAVVDINTGSFATRINTLESQVNTVGTGILARITTVEQTAANLQTGKADASRVTSLESAVNTPTTGILARLTTAETTSANLQLNKADASRVVTLESQVQTPGTGLLARTGTLETTTANLQTGKADASRVTTLESQVNTAGSGILARLTTVEQTVSNSDVGALTTRVTTIEGQVNSAGTGILARLTSAESSVANLQTGKASVSSVQALEATVNTPTTGLTARVTVAASAIADINGRLVNSWSVIFDGNGVMSGMKLLQENGSGVTRTTFDMYVDQFRLWTGSTAVPMFEANAGGVFVGGSKVRTESMVENSVSNAVTAYTASALGMSSGVEYTAQAVTIQAKGGRIKIEGVARFFADTSQGQGSTVRIYRSPAGAGAYTLVYEAPGPTAQVSEVSISANSYNNPFQPVLASDVVTDMSWNNAFIVASATGQDSGGDSHNLSVNISAVNASSITETKGRPTINMQGAPSQILTSFSATLTYNLNALVPVMFMDFPGSGNWDYVMTAIINGTNAQVSHRFLCVEETKR